MGYVIVLAVAFGCTLVLTPVVRRLAVAIGAVVAPGERRVHVAPMPTIGGAAMYVSFLAAMGVAWQLEEFDAVFASSSEPLGVILAATVIFAVGSLDDLREVSAPAKTAGQVFAGSVLYLFGVTMFFFRIPYGDILVLSPDIAPLVTVLWVMGMANAINLIDGLDGLAAGIVGIAAGAYFLYGDRLVDVGLIGQDNISPLLAVIVVGVCLGFLPHNFHPGRIMMGDAGALFLGLLMAASTMVVGGRTADAFSGQTFFFFAPLFIPLVILGVPIFDTAFAILRRASRRAGVATADKEHLHHRLMRLGHGQRRSVLILWTWTALLSAFVLYPVYTDEGNAVVPFGVAALGVGLFTVLHPQVRRGRGATTDEAAGPADAPGGEVGLAVPGDGRASGNGRSAATRSPDRRSD